VQTCPRFSVFLGAMLPNSRIQVSCYVIWRIVGCGEKDINHVRRSLYGRSRSIYCLLYFFPNGKIKNRLRYLAQIFLDKWSYPPPLRYLAQTATLSGANRHVIWRTIWLFLMFLQGSESACGASIARIIKEMEGRNTQEKMFICALTLVEKNG